MKQFQKFLISIDKDLNVLKCNDVFLEYIGTDEIHNLDQIIPPQDVMQLRNALFAVNPGKTGFTCFRVRTMLGTLNWIASNIEKSETFDGPISMELSDIQTLKSENTSGTYDKMTGLLSKTAITDYLRELMDEVPAKTFYVFLMDIDHFKSVNDTFGHMRGDEVIIEVAHIIQDCVGDNGVVGRIGGDEFMLVLENISVEVKLREVLSKIRDTVREKYINYGGKLDITVSLGGALFPTYAKDYDSMFMLADKMLYLAKSKGRDRYIIYTPSVHGVVGLNGKMMTPLEHMAMNSSKITLIKALMRDYLCTRTIDVPDALHKVADTYDIDKIYIINRSDFKSRYGIVREVKDNVSTITPSEISMPILGSDNFTTIFDANRIAAVNVYEIDKEKKADLSTFMIENGYRSMVACLIESAGFKGFIVFISRMNSPCRLSEASLADLIYFTSLLELSAFSTPQ